MRLHGSTDTTSLPRSTTRPVRAGRVWVRWLAGMLAVTVGLAACQIDDEVSEDDEPIAAGSSVFELLVLKDDLDAAFNIVFVPDDSYGDMSALANRQAFVTDIADVVENGYWQNQAYFNGLFHYNYFYMTESGSVTPRPDTPEGDFQCPTVTWPSEADTDAAFADQLLLIHSNTLRDCGGGGRATAEPTSFRTVVHETGHGLFGLPDEYCCDSFYRSVPPVMYASESECDTDPRNATWRDCRSLTSSRDDSVWWRSQGHIVDDFIMLSFGDTVFESGPADSFVMVAAAADLGATVGGPSVFAPDPWDYTVPTP